MGNEVRVKVSKLLTKPYVTTGVDALRRCKSPRIQSTQRTSLPVAKLYTNSFRDAKIRATEIVSELVDDDPTLLMEVLNRLLLYREEVRILIQEWSGKGNSQELVGFFARYSELKKRFKEKRWEKYG